ncbi:Formyl-CoA:oxalate CoA-transferase [Geodia barretti]|uniref:Formyl-CoA:oxalate CoA-transferase n=1 Tax=Geodia barretti TaxID=519541 RepID=A0AA35WA02_GEOBA|nr:Formyl-CoA:oxalate CoA-transferase [Geodia barretti]
MEMGDEINTLIESWTMQHDKFEVMRILGELGIPASACFNAIDIYSDEHLLEREMIVSVDHPTRGKFKVPGAQSRCRIRMLISKPRRSWASTRRVTPIPEEYEAFTKALADFGQAGVCRGVGKLTATAFDDGKIIVAQADWARRSSAFRRST